MFREAPLACLGALDFRKALKKEDFFGNFFRFFSIFRFFFPRFFSFFFVSCSFFCSFFFVFFSHEIPPNKNSSLDYAPGCEASGNCALQKTQGSKYTRRSEGQEMRSGKGSKDCRRTPLVQRIRKYSPRILIV